MQASLRDGRRTKIVCTIGPASETAETIEALVDAGMNVARLNFSHGTPQWHRERVALLREVSARRDRPLGILLDIPGPKLRIGEIPGGPVTLRRGDIFRFVTETVAGDVHRVSVTYSTLPEELQPGDRVFLGDGDIELRVESTAPGEVVCTVRAGGLLSSHKGMNFPTRTLAVPSVTDVDRTALALGAELAVDFIALSFVRTGDDVRMARAALGDTAPAMPLVAKIEKHEALDNLGDILAAADALLVARGDLAVDIPLEDVPRAQKRIIRAANDAGKPVITATQMLRSMVAARRPTRAEITDVANALYDGTDAVMLSEETAVGVHPAEVVEVMSRICMATERDMFTEHARRLLPPARRNAVPDVVASAATLVAEHLQVDALLVPTRTGSTAAKMAEIRPRQPILAISTDPATVGRLTLSWGVTSLLGNEVPTHEAMLHEAERVAVGAGLLDPGDLVVITAGFPVGGPGSTNTVTVKTIGEELADGSTGDVPAARGPRAAAS